MKALPKLTPAQLNLQPIGQNTGGDPVSVLYGEVVICGCRHHVNAIQVKHIGSGIQSPVNSAYEDEVNALYDMSGDSITTATIDGRDYVFAIFPHSA